MESAFDYGSLTAILALENSSPDPINTIIILMRCEFFPNEQKINGYKNPFYRLAELHIACSNSICFIEWHIVAMW